MFGHQDDNQDGQDWQHPGTPLDDNQAGQPAPVEPAEPAEPSSSDDLVDIRQKALGDLSPLIGHLDNTTPEEKFQVTMMMIQANDDKSLLKTAYEAAQQISDEKVRAQALLDVIQEINYFTQHQAD